MLSDSERKLVKALFKDRGAKHQTFLLYDLAGQQRRKKKKRSLLEATFQKSMLLK
jgi:hypothetical protein